MNTFVAAFRANYWCHPANQRGRPPAPGTPSSFKLSVRVQAQSFLSTASASARASLLKDPLSSGRGSWHVESIPTTSLSTRAHSKPIWTRPVAQSPGTRRTRCESSWGQRSDAPSVLFL